MTVFAITGSGLIPATIGNIKLTANRCYYLGASSDPDEIFVSSVNHETGWFEYYKTPIHSNSEPRRDMIKYSGDLIRQGCETRLRVLDRYDAFHKENPPSWIAKQRAHLKAVLAGEPGDESCLGEHKTYDVEVKVSDNIEDDWRYLDGLTGGCCNYHSPKEGTYGITAHSDGHLAELRANENLTIVKETWREDKWS